MSKFTDAELRTLRENGKLPLVKELIADLQMARAALRKARPYVQGTFDNLKFTNHAYVVQEVLDDIDDGTSARSDLVIGE